MGEIKDPPDFGGPPSAPELPRAIHLYPGQWIGLPLLLLIPVLALFGMFGETRAEATISAGNAELVLEHPQRVRRGQRTEVKITVRNTSGDPIDASTIRFEGDYLGGFGDLALTPQNGGSNVIRVPALGPGSSWTARIEMEAGRPGRSEGEVFLSRSDRGIARVPISSFILP